jgi:hypothetical protein
MQRLTRDIDWMREDNLTIERKNELKADFYRFFTEHDKRRGTNFLKTFPKMREWWLECEQHAKEN